MSTHIELPQGTHKYKDGGGTEKTTTTFIGDNDIRSISKADFDVICAKTNQMVIGDLETPGYGQIDTTINYDTKDTLLQNNILGKPTLTSRMNYSKPFALGLPRTLLTPSLEWLKLSLTQWATRSL